MKIDRPFVIFLLQVTVALLMIPIFFVTQVPAQEEFGFFEQPEASVSRERQLYRAPEQDSGPEFDLEVEFAKLRAKNVELIRTVEVLQWRLDREEKKVACIRAHLDWLFDYVKSRHGEGAVEVNKKFEECRE